MNKTLSFFCVFAALLLTGCGTPVVLMSAERSVVIQSSMEAYAKTQPLADKECAKSGRKASFKYQTDGYPSKYFYDCLL